MTADARVATFYSYKGGTGRTMALANVAWILASAGKRVLILDWDLEAPGVHRYFAPVLADPELAQSEGLIDWLYSYVLAATKPPSAQLERGEAETLDAHAWVEPYLDLSRYTLPVELSFGGGGGIDIVGAGRQNATYGVRVNTFDWLAFYQRFFGAAFLSRAIERAREDYDYILIDSRTGVSDTSGICTVQLPDALVVFFTLNRQSILGVSGVVQDVLRQRQKVAPDKELARSARDICIWPVPTRVEPGEQKKLSKMRKLAREQLAPLLETADASRDWADALLQAETPYVPYYAYEEVLATIADEPRAPNTVLSACERITANLTNDEVSSLSPISPALRRDLLARWEGPDGGDEPTAVQSKSQARPYDVVILDTDSSVKGLAGAIYAELNARCHAFYAERSVKPGDDWTSAITEAIASAKAAVVVAGSHPTERARFEIGMLEERALREPALRVIPVVHEGGAVGLPPALSSRRRVDGSGRVRIIVEQLVDALGIGKDQGTTAALPTPTIGEDDPFRRLRPWWTAVPVTVSAAALAAFVALVGVSWQVYATQARRAVAAALNANRDIERQRQLALTARTAAQAAETARDDANKNWDDCKERLANVTASSEECRNDLEQLRSQAGGPLVACEKSLKAANAQRNDFKESISALNQALATQSVLASSCRSATTQLQACSTDRTDLRSKLDVCEKKLGSH